MPDVPERLMEAQYLSHKLAALHVTDVTLERLRFMVRLTKDLKLLSGRQSGRRSTCRAIRPCDGTVRRALDGSHLMPYTTALMRKVGLFRVFSCGAMQDIAVPGGSGDGGDEVLGA